jgi:hypothetical protein
MSWYLVKHRDNFTLTFYITMKVFVFHVEVFQYFIRFVSITQICESLPVRRLPPPVPLIKPIYNAEHIMNCKEMITVSFTH